jgi:hypothetical protein
VDPVPDPLLLRIATAEENRENLSRMICALAEIGRSIFRNVTA